LDERRQRAPGLSESALRLQVCQRRNACCSCQRLRDARWLHAAWLLPEACKLIVVALACVFGNRHETCQGYQHRNACCSCQHLLDARWLLEIGYCLELANSCNRPETCAGYCLKLANSLSLPWLECSVTVMRLARATSGVMPVAAAIISLMQVGCCSLAITWNLQTLCRCLA
jgi:hypothetical protein